ncbi:hypothetical protein RCO48_06260 [Peribacillus frigoritolerans]|nr:hypothetical protein [Peribacillus frigoritolerans]
MLSLVVVLSVYYLTAPEENAADMTATEQMEQEENKTESKTENKAETKGENKSEKRNFQKYRRFLCNHCIWR